LVRRKKNKYTQWILGAAFLVVALWLTQKIYNRFLYRDSQANLGIVERTWLNYKDKVIQASKETGLPANYLLALIALECSGMKDVPSRFEPHIFDKLSRVQEGEIENFEGIKPEDILYSSEDALRNLASSWGPFQLMGYQCFHLDIKIKEMRGNRSVYYGAIWIKKTYGKSLEEKKFKDAFHIHNTGKKYPKVGPPRTHSKYYVPRGLKFMKEFEVLLSVN